MQPPHKGQKILLRLFWTYFSSMLFSFTGGSMTWPLVQHRLESEHLMDRSRALEYYILGQSVPGVLSLNTAVMIGRDIAGFPGVLAASAGVILPAFFGMLLVTAGYTYILGIPFLQRILQGIRAGAAALIAANAAEIIHHRQRRSDWILIAAAFFLLLLLENQVLLVIAGAGLLGVLRAWCFPRKTPALPDLSAEEEDG